MGAAMDDQRLVALAQEGNPDAFSLLVERHQTMVYNLALGKTGSPQDAEEVTQTAFLKAWQGLPAFQGKAAFSSWLYRLTMNAAIDLLRQRSRRPQTLSLDDPDLPPVPDPAEDPQAQAEAQERRRQLWQAIDALPEGPPHPLPAAGDGGVQLPGNRQGPGAGGGDGQVPPGPGPGAAAQRVAQPRELLGPGSV